MDTTTERGALVARLVDRDDATEPEDVESAAIAAEDGATNRYLLIEHGATNRYPRRRWYSTHASPVDAMHYADHQEYAEDWFVWSIIDLDTSEVVEMERRYIEVKRYSLDLDGD